MRDISRSTLVGRKATFVGFGFDRHPLDPKSSIQITVYRLSPNEQVLCLSQVETPDADAAREDLGWEVTGEQIAPFVARFIGGPLKLVHKVVKDAYPHVNFEWHQL